MRISLLRHYIAYAIILSHIAENLYKMSIKINDRRLHEKFLLSQKCEKGKRGSREEKFESSIRLIRNVHLETGVIFYPVCCPADYFF